MPEEIVGFNEDDAAAILEATDRTLGGPLRPRGEAAHSPRLRGIIPWFGEVTSLTTSSGRYPATLERYNPDTATWDTLDVCWIVAANGETLELKRYACLHYGILTADLKPVLVTNCCG